MKLKMGNSDQKQPEQNVTETKNTEEKEEPVKNVTEEKKQSEVATQNEPAAKPEIKSETENKEKVEDVESLRKVIKLDTNTEKKEPEKKESSPPKEEKKEKKPEKPKEEEDDLASLIGSSGGKDDDIPEPSGSRESLEQKRAILQSIKDFDFQIKKNQEDIGGLSQKLDSLSKDLDDLVSLYEIVSEQMNPFVGLSKVTKKRFDQLENLMKNIDSLNARIDDIESSAGRTAVQKAVKVEKISENPVTQEINFSYDDADIDRIIEMSLGSFVADSKIDNLIDQFIEKLKDENSN